MDELVAGDRYPDMELLEVREIDRWPIERPISWLVYYIVAR